MRCATFFVFLPALLLGGPAMAQKARFGGRGIIVPKGGVGLDYEIRRPPQGDSTATTDFLIAPGLLVFVAENIAVGGSVLLDVRRSDPQDSLSFGLRPEVAYNVQLTPAVSLMPTGWMAYASTSVEAFGGDVETRRFSAGVDLPFLVHLAPHLFIGGGPYVSYDLWAKVVSSSRSTNTDKLASFGARSIIGGWF